LKQDSACFPDEVFDFNGVALGGEASGRLPADAGNRVSEVDLAFIWVYSQLLANPVEIAGVGIDSAN
jgi:hypothetical protein